MISISKPLIGEAEKAAVMEVLESGFLVQGPRTAKFEERFAEMCGVKYAIAVSSGTAALYIALLANGIEPGDEVITVPFTFIATVNAILYTGAKPVFVDVDETTFNIDPELIEQAITNRTKAILPVHLYGQMCNMDALQSISERYGVKIIEDACQAVFATYKGKYAGSFGTGTFSFYATKNLMTGEGGMITTNDESIAQECRYIRNHGMQRRYMYEKQGFNFRITDLQSAIGLAQIERLPELTAKRRANATFLNAGIESLIKPKENKDCQHVWHQYTVRMKDGKDRDRAIEKLSEAGIGTGIYYPIPVHRYAYVRELVGDVVMPVSERLAEDVFSIPVHPQLTEADLVTIVEEVNKL